MEHEIKKIQKEEERNIITGMIISPEYMQHIRPLCKLEYFHLPYTRMVANWCVEYFDKYETAPKENIKSIYEHKCRDIDEDRAEMIRNFLDSISEKYSENGHYNVEYHLDKTINYFKEKSIDIFLEKVQGAKLSGNFEEAEAEIANFKRIEKHISGGIDVMNDKSAVISTIQGTTDSDFLMRMPGALGEMLGPFNRSDFITVVGPGKRSKTSFLLEIAILALFKKLNVVFFSLEMTEKRMLQRIYQRMTGEVNFTKSDDHIQNKEIRLPRFDSNWKTSGEILYKTVTKKGLSVKKTLNKITSVDKLIDNKKFHLICRPAGSMTVSDMELCLDNLEYYDGVVPDVVINDYADLTKSSRNGDKRNQIDDIWMGLRAMAQKRNCLVVTATHSAKATFDRDIRPNDLSEDIRKLNHVTLAFGLNQDPEEKEKQIMRISVLASRFEHFNPIDECVVLQCLDICRPYIDSRKNNKVKSK